jgi:hypothetical protein
MMDTLLGGCAFMLLMVAPVLAVIAIRARYGEAYGEIMEPGSSGGHQPPGDARVTVPRPVIFVVE